MIIKREKTLKKKKKNYFGGTTKAEGRRGRCTRSPHTAVNFFTYSLTSPFPWFHYQQPTTSKSAEPIFRPSRFLLILWFVLWGFLDSLSFMDFLEAPEIQILGVAVAAVAVVAGAAYFYSTRKPKGLSPFPLWLGLYGCVCLWLDWSFLCWAAVFLYLVWNLNSGFSINAIVASVFLFHEKNPKSLTFYLDWVGVSITDLLFFIICNCGVFTSFAIFVLIIKYCGCCLSQTFYIVFFLSFGFVLMPWLGLSLPTLFSLSFLFI